jgi:hypothetical protein
MVTLASYPVAPATTPRQGTLLDAATVTDGIAWLNEGDDLFESYNAMTFGASPEFCAPNVKDFDNNIGWVDGFRFGAYGGVQCRAVGLDRDKMLSEVRRVFETGESTAVERAFMDIRFRARTDYWAAPTDITPAGGAVKPAVGVALLEGYFSSVYVGQPTLHLPIAITSLLLGVNGLDDDSAGLHTRLGSKVAAGAGYDFPNEGPDGAAAPAGERWLYATGEVLVRRGPVEVRQAIDHTNNDVYVLAERAYIGASDGPVVAVRVKVES